MYQAESIADEASRTARRSWAKTDPVSAYGEVESTTWSVSAQRASS